VSSRRKHRKQNIPQGSRPGDDVVNTQINRVVFSFPPAPTGEKSGEVKAGLMEKVVRRSNILNALDRVEKNQGAPGVDGMQTDELRRYLNENGKENWKRIESELLDGTYKPSPLRRKTIPKPGGGERQLGIPTVTDRLIQQAILQVLTPIFDPGFSKSSYGFRPGRKAHQAVKQAEKFITAGRIYVVDMDLEKFFDRVNHDILISRVARKVGDKSLLKILRSFLESGVMENGCCVATGEGTPQGGPISPLLANIMLDDLDKELEKRGHSFCRYADDCNIYVKSLRAGKRVLDSLRKLLENQLKLKVNESKSAVDHPWNRKFLGFSFTMQEIPRIKPAPKAIEKFREKIRELTKRSRSISMDDRITQLNGYINGWIGYFQLADTISVFQRLDKWIRRRLRTCVLKQWKLPSTRRQNLTALGLSEKSAGNISGSGKGCHRLSRTPQLHTAMGIAFWSAHGLVSLEGQYQKLRIAL